MSASDKIRTTRLAPFRFHTSDRIVTPQIGYSGPKGLNNTTNMTFYTNGIFICYSSIRCSIYPTKHTAVFTVNYTSDPFTQKSFNTTIQTTMTNKRQLCNVLVPFDNSTNTDINIAVIDTQISLIPDDADRAHIVTAVSYRIDHLVDTSANSEYYFFTLYEFLMTHFPVVIY